MTDDTLAQLRLQVAGAAFVTRLVRTMTLHVADHADALAPVVPDDMTGAEALRAFASILRESVDAMAAL